MLSVAAVGLVLKLACGQSLLHIEIEYTDDVGITLENK